MLEVVYSNKFKKDFKLIKKRGYTISKLKEVLEILVKKSNLQEKYRDHALTGELLGFRELHIAPDWLLIYKIESTTLILARTGTHSDLFN